MHLSLPLTPCHRGLESENKEPSERPHSPPEHHRPWEARTQAPEDDVLQVERVFDDASGRHTDPKHVLLGAQVA